MSARSILSSKRYPAGQAGNPRPNSAGRCTAAAGARGAGTFFGTADDAKTGGGAAGVFSRIGSVTIKGQALGTVGGSDAFGIVAELIDSVKVGLSIKTLVVWIGGGQERKNDELRRQ